MLKYYNLLVLFLLVFVTITGYSQSVGLTKENGVEEQLLLITDRDSYCVEESVHCKVYYRNPLQKDNLQWSNIVYCEIITPDGRTISGEKFELSGNQATGELFIPRNVLSGCYYIQVYTKWMRNQSLNSRYFKQIEIINPFTPDLLTKVDVPVPVAELRTDQKQLNELISLKTIVDTFQVKNKIGFTVSLKNLGNLINDFSIMIVPKGSNKNNEVVPVFNDNKQQDIKYIPETRGVSLTGKVIDQKDSMPLSFSTVWITLLSKEPLTREKMTDENGNFYFDLGDEWGQHELFIQATTSKESVSPVVKVDNDFAYSTLNLPFIPFKPGQDERTQYQELMVKGQLDKIFRVGKTIDTSKIIPTHFFYGKPDQTIILSNYIEMPTLADYVHELIPYVKIRKNGSGSMFKIESTNPDMDFYNSLAMIDLIKIDDANSMLSISPKEIDRIEIINKPYIRSEITYGGIIHFITKSGKFSDFKFPGESMFLDYKLLKKTESNEPSDSSSRLPVVGNCLYWNPSVSFSSGKDTSITLPSGNEPGEYDIVIEGIDSNFKCVQYRKSIVVR